MSGHRKHEMLNMLFLIIPFIIINYSIYCVCVRGEGGRERERGTENERETVCMYRCLPALKGGGRENRCMHTHTGGGHVWLHACAPPIRMHMQERSNDYYL